jgi:hypothetical protein
MTVQLTDQLDMTASCTDNQLIMEPAHIQQYTPDEQLDINLARMYHQAVWLSDLTEGDGLRIRPPCLQGQRDTMRTTKYE